MSETIDLSKLAKPFPVDDIEWRVSRAGHGKGKPYCIVFAYITARAIQKRLDDVCGAGNWGLEQPLCLDVNGKSAFACGIKIRIGDEWVTKWDVAGATSVEPAKGGFSGAMKRAGAQWGIGRYLYHLKESFAETSEDKVEGWEYAKLPKDGGVYYWQHPRLPEWALPKDEITKENLEELALAWRDKFAVKSETSAEKRKDFAQFVRQVAGEFPVTDHACWTEIAYEKCWERIEATTDPEGPDADVPFGEKVDG